MPVGGGADADDVEDDAAGLDGEGQAEQVVYPGFVAVGAEAGGGVVAHVLVLGKDVADGVVLGMVAEYAAVEQVTEELVSGLVIGCPKVLLFSTALARNSTYSFLGYNHINLHTQEVLR